MNCGRDAVIGTLSGNGEGVSDLKLHRCGPHLLKGGFREQASTGVDVYSIRQPLGVVAGITPFNFPAMVPMWMFANALVCGNTFVLKPSEKDPSASLLLADLLRQAGLPDGVFNVVQGDRVAVDALLEHPDVAALSFVGSTPIARHVYEAGTRAGKRVQALGGAKNHMVVLPDADVDAGRRRRGLAPATARRASAAWRSPSSSRSAPSPTRWSRRSRPDRPDCASARPPTRRRDGPADHQRAPRQGRRLPRRGAGRRRDVVVDGRDGAVRRRRVLPRRLAGRPGDARTRRCYTDEIFGPVLSVVRVDTYDEALRLVNDNPYGNGTAIFTRDGGAARQFQYDVDCGMVGVNVPIPVPVAYYSFGGWKASLFGDLHMYGPEGIALLHAHQGRHLAAGPTRPPSEVDLGFPKVR